MPLSLDDKLIWGSWYVHDGQRWHGYFMQVTSRSAIRR